VTVIVTQAPKAGDSGELTICSGQLSVDLFTGLGGDPDFNGIWHDDDGTGRLSSNFFNPGIPAPLPPGHYSFTYVVPANGLCAADSATVGVTIVALLDAGSNGTITVCSSQTQVNLFTGLSGTPQPGGTWIDLDNTGLLTGQYFNANGVSGAGPYHFRYRLTGALGCSSDSAVASVTVVAAPNAGVDATATFCSTGSPVGLLQYLGLTPPGTGTWRKPPPGNQIFNGNYDPPNFTPGDYTYTVNGTPPCANAVGTVHVVETPGPQAGDPAVTNVCSSDAAFNMTQRLGGTPDINGTWVDPFLEMHSNIFVPGLDPPGVYLYTVSGVFPCGNVTVSLTVNVFPAAYAGADVAITVCDNSSSFLLFPLLESSGAQNTNVAWYDPSMALFPSANYVPGTSQPGTYTYTVTGTSPCGADTATVTIFETTSPNAGTSTSATFCSNGPAVALVNLLAGADPTGTWVGPAPTNAYFSGTFQPGANAPGVYTYRVQGLPPCANDSSTVTVSVAPAPYAGISSSITVCQSSPAFAMVDSLGGNAPFGGLWTTLPGGLQGNGVFTPSSAAPGTYSFLYTVMGSGSTPCSPAHATLSITVNAAPNAGVHGTLTLCSTSGVTSLFPFLGVNAQPGGTWTFQGVAHGSSFDPHIDASGDYVYTVNGVAPCPSASASVTVTLNQAPNAGSNGVITICDNDLTPIVLGDLLGGTHDQVINGWTLDGTPVSDIYLPGDYAAGVHTFTYTVPGSPPCAASTAQVTIIQNAAPHAGNDASLSVCSTDPAVDLFNLLGGADATGNWVDTNGVAVSPTFLPSAHAPGSWVYYYIVQGNAPCQDDSSTVSIMVDRKPQAGVSTAPQVCSNSGAISLLGLLGGTYDNNGSWVFQPATGPGILHGPVFNPLVDGPGAYVYTVTGSDACGNATATAQITLVPAPNAGTSGTISVCASESALSLFPVIGGTAATGGAWTDNDATGQLSNGTFNASAAGPGLYHFTYTVAGTGPCASASSIVSVTVTDALDAGSDNALSLCASETNVDLFSSLGGSPQPGGTWTGVESSAGLTNGVLNAGVAGVGVHHYRYVLVGSANCTPDTAVITATILNGPVAGSDGFISTCSNASPVDLFTLLGGQHDTNGTWYYPNSGAAMTGSTITPGTDPAGAYLYVVLAIGSCPADSATVTVTIPQAPNAGTNGSLAFCEDGSPQDLGTGLGGTPDPGGSWFHGNPAVLHDSIYSPVNDNPGPYVYRVIGQSPCANAEATVNVSEITAPYAGQDNSYTVCEDVGPFNMLPHLAGAGNPQNNGHWYRLGTPISPHLSTYNPAVDSSGVFLYVVNGTGPCANDSAHLTVIEVRAPQAGQSTAIVACPTDDAVDVFAPLGPGVDTTGEWTGPNATLLDGNILDATQVPLGTYAFTYVVTAQSPCANDSATVVVNVGAGLNAGTGGNDSICGSLTEYDLFNSLSGSPDLGGTWSEQTGDGAINDHYLDATSLVPDAAYTMVYTLTDPTCGNISSVVDLYIAPFPSPGGDSSIVLCTTSPLVPLASFLTGHVQPGGNWTGPSGSGHNAFLDPAVDSSGAYTYHLGGTQFCSDTSAQVTVVVNPPAYAGEDSSALVCNSGPAALFPLLANGPQTGGTWSDITGSGAMSADTVDLGLLVPGTYVFDYQVDVEGCPSDTAEVALQVVDGVAVQDVERICDETYRTYVVRFTVTGGDPAGYVVSGGEGSLTTSAPYVFTSTPFFTSQSFQFSVDDENHCAPQTVEGETPCNFDEPVIVPESFTPNGDHINDRLVIPGIEGFPRNTIVIYNRWGGEVYKASGYDNVRVFWDGSSPNALLSGNATTGTYYYVLDLGNGGDPVKGFIYLNR
jgi:gliding motility-associated-like protein